MSEPTTKPLLRLKELTVSFDGNVVVDALSLTVNAGETLAIVGESGSGKSVSALGAIDLLPSNAEVRGQRWLEETDLTRLNKRDWNGIRGNRVGFIFQEPMTSLNPLHRIGKQISETLRLHQGLSGQAARRRAKTLLEQVKLPRPEELLDAWPHQLSGGQRQRVMIAMAIANNPALLIADEPTTALDVTVQQEILALLKELRDQHGMGVLLISHDLNLVRRHADRVCVMYQGKVQEAGSVTEVFSNPQSDYTKALIAAEPEGRPAEPANTTPLLTTQQLRVSFKRPKTGLFQRQPPAFEALKATNLTIAPGETLGIVGESGSGKRHSPRRLCVWSPARARCSLAIHRSASSRVTRCAASAIVCRWCFRTPTVPFHRGCRYSILSVKACAFTIQSLPMRKWPNGYTAPCGKSAYRKAVRPATLTSFPADSANALP